MFVYVYICYGIKTYTIKYQIPKTYLRNRRLPHFLIFYIHFEQSKVCKVGLHFPLNVFIDCIWFLQSIILKSQKCKSDLLYCMLTIDIKLRQLIMDNT